MAVRRPRLSYGALLTLAMLAAISLVGGAMLLDEQREFEEALAALRDEQVALATAVAADLGTRLQRVDEQALRGAPQGLRSGVRQLLGGAAELQQKSSRVIVVLPPWGPPLFGADGRSRRSSALVRAFAGGVTELTLEREHGPALGLPERIVVAGLRQVRAPTGQIWGVAVLASAERLRNRERRAQLRFLLALGLVTLVVGGFGGLALRDQRRKLALARELEVAALQRDRESLLAKADKLATLAALSSGVAHQIATPLGTITARVEQVMPVVSSHEKASAALRIVHEQVQRIQQTIRGLLDLARGNQPSLVHTPPEQVVRAALRSVSHRFERGSVKVEVTFAPQLPVIACDPPILEQAVVNLLLNALEASAAGARVDLRVHAAEGKLFILVDDEGHGITDEVKQRAGEPFYTTKQRRGTGLGLAIAQEVVANHGGKLSLERREPRGTRATIELPAA